MTRDGGGRVGKRQARDELEGTLRRAQREADERMQGRAGKGQAPGLFAAMVDMDAEAGVLGGVLLRNGDLTGLELEVDDFWDPRHRAIFGAYRNLEARMVAIDLVTLEAELAAVGKLDAIGIGYIGEIALRTPTAENVEHYARIVRQHRVSRELVIACSEMVEAAKSGALAGDELVSESIGRLLRIESGRADPVTSIGDAVRAEMTQIESDLSARARGEQVLVGMPTGLRGLDERVGGWPFSVMSLVLARPANGKTTIGDHACWAAERYGNDVPLFFTFEDSVRSFAQRRMAGASGVPTSEIRSRNLDAGRVRELAQGYPAAMSSRGLLIKCAGWTVEDIVRCARRIRARSHVYARDTGRTVGRLMVVDYLQKVRNPDWARGNRNLGLGWISNVLSDYAQDEDSAVLALSQVTRDVERSEDHIPRLDNARDSGEIEQHAKFALGLLRPWNYDPNADPTELQAHVLKNHNGPANGYVQIYWEIETHTLANTALEVHARRRASFMEMQ